MVLIILAILNYFISGIIVYDGGFISILLFVLSFLSFEKPKIYGIIGSVFSSCGIMIIGITFIYYVRHYTRYDDILYAGPLASLNDFIVSICILFIVVLDIVQIPGFGKCMLESFISMWYYNWGNKIIKSTWKV